ncbi:nuclear transport factor 2 family protein [Streptosporangium sp. NPDC048865]|uniref:nuclear transport factor 2 family protein n=1 Tax=Streptosporangium sp. NPDC048865 TaxID=3155766 RepID=UPI00341A4877
MSEQSIDIVKRLYEGLTKLDIPTVLGSFDPEVEIIAPQSLPWSKGSYRGIDGAAAYFGSAVDYLEETRFDVEDLLPSGDWVTALGYWSGRFKSTKKEFRVQRLVHAPSVWFAAIRHSSSTASP